MTIHMTTQLKYTGVIPVPKPLTNHNQTIFQAVSINLTMWL